MKLGLHRGYDVTIVRRGREAKLARPVHRGELAVLERMGIVVDAQPVAVVELSDELAAAASERVTRVRQDVERLALRTKDRTSLIGKVLAVHRELGL